MAKLTEAQRRHLACITDGWMEYPIQWDSRPMQVLLRLGYVEQRSTDVTPANFEPSPVRFVRVEIRSTEAGRAALTAQEPRHGRD
jgi:hypothetical protein